MSVRLVIEAIPCLSDNYAWLVFDPDRQDAVVVDPGQAAPVLTALQARGLRLRALLATHHHHDHVGGIAGVLQGVPKRAAVAVIGSAHDVAACRIPHATQAVRDHETLPLLGAAWQALATPGHTQGAVSYHLPSSAAVFTGDTLFLAGCGRLLEGSAAQQLASLTRLAALPEKTQIYCGHEYTLKNLRFAAELLPASAPLAAAVQDAQTRRAQGMPSVPGPLSQQLRVNPFLQAGDARLATALGTDGTLATFAALRARRDQF